VVEEVEETKGTGLGHQVAGHEAAPALVFRIVEDYLNAHIGCLVFAD